MSLAKIAHVEGLKKIGKQVGRMTVVTGGVFAANAASAAIDTTGAIAEIDSATTAITAVGGAIITLAALAMAYRWVKATFF
jgi:hypothetical protein